jgi:5-methylcytosine-specific restriction endonuclease McrA
MHPGKTGNISEMLQELQALNCYKDGFEVKSMNEWMNQSYKNYKPEIKKHKRKSISKSKRFRILNRDKFRCQCCGRNPKEDGVKLEIDHILPVSKGGKNDYNNLQTLCRDCNRGKGDKIFSK